MASSAHFLWPAMLKWWSSSMGRPTVGMIAERITLPIVTVALFEEREGGFRGALHNAIIPAGPCYLRVERKGSRIMGATSIDGTTWKQLQPIDTLWPSTLRVGLSAINSSNESFSPRFEEFVLKGKNK